MEGPRDVLGPPVPDRRRRGRAEPSVELRGPDGGVRGDKGVCLAVRGALGLLRGWGEGGAAAGGLLWGVGYE